jgi:hypothetical protein
MAQAFGTLADHIDHATGYTMVPVPFAELPAEPAAGMVRCVSDSGVTGWGAKVTSGGFHKVLAWYNGTNWTVIGK